MQLKQELIAQWEDRQANAINLTWVFHQPMICYRTPITNTNKKFEMHEKKEMHERGSDINNHCIKRSKKKIWMGEEAASTTPATKRIMKGETKWMCHHLMQQWKARRCNRLCRSWAIAFWYRMISAQNDSLFKQQSSRPETPEVRGQACCLQKIWGFEWKQTLNNFIETSIFFTFFFFSCMNVQGKFTTLWPVWLEVLIANNFSAWLTCAALCQIFSEWLRLLEKKI